MADWTSIEPQIQEVIDRMESYRTASIPKVIGYGALLGCGLTVVVMLFFYCLLGFNDFSEGWPVYLIILAICFIGSMVGTCNHYYSNLKTIYKSEVMPQMVEVICDNATYESQGGVGRSVFYNSNLFGWDSTTFLREEDCIRGVVDKTDFIFCESHLGHEETTTDQKGRTTTHEVTDFRGMVFYADFNKHFSGQTIITTSSMLLFSFKKIKLESIDFNKNYTTRTTNEQEARYLLSPALQERLVQLRETLKSTMRESSLTISLQDSRILILINTNKDRFEPTFVKKLTLEHVKNDFACIKAMIDIVEALNLNTRIWTKE